MRKVLSIVLALLMVSMMIPSMAFADGTLVTGAPTAALVATESFTLTATEAVTVKVNASVFDIGGEVDEATNIETKDFEAGEITITVEDAIPAEQFTSTIRVEAGEVKENIEITIKDRLIGDVDGVGGITATDAGYALAAAVGKTVVPTVGVYKEAAANADAVGGVTATDAGYILAAAVGKAVDAVPGMGTAYIGGNDTDAKIADPNYDATVTPPVEAEPLPSVEKVTAVVSDGTIYYDFTAVTGATGYQISVNGAVVLENTAELTGSFAAPEGFDAAAANTLSVVALGDGETTENSEATSTTISVATPSTALAQWLEANGLEDVVITVYEITAE